MKRACLAAWAQRSDDNASKRHARQAAVAHWQMRAPIVAMRRWTAACYACKLQRWVQHDVLLHWAGVVQQCQRARQFLSVLGVSDATHAACPFTACLVDSSIVCNIESFWRPLPAKNSMPCSICMVAGRHIEGGNADMKLQHLC